MGVTPDLMEKIQNYHIGTRAFQLSEIKDPVYGFTSPKVVFSHNQVPLELLDKNEITIDNLGVDDVYDSVGKDEDSKRFCTLNLFGAMGKSCVICIISLSYFIFLYAES